MNLDKINTMKDLYLKEFQNRILFENEGFKWTGFQEFKDNWNLDSDDFSKMLELSLKRIIDLNSGPQGEPLKRLIYINDINNNFVKNQFVALFDEQIDVYKRIIDFIENYKSEITTKNGYDGYDALQDRQSAAIYLMLKFPKKYYFYEYSNAKKVNKYLECKIVKTTINDRIPSCYKLYDEIKKELFNDNEFINKINDILESNGYSTEFENLLVCDFVYFITKKIENQKNEEDDDQKVNYWYYAPGNHACKWEEFKKANTCKIDYQGIGDLNLYNKKQDLTKAVKNSHRNNTLASIPWSFSKEAKINDIIFVKNGIYEIIAWGKIRSKYYFDDSSSDGFEHTFDVEWHELKTSYSRDGLIFPQSAFCHVDNPEVLNELKKLCILSEEKIEADPIAEFDEDEFLKNTFIEKESFNKITRLLLNKKNLILQGAPGVGKSYIAKNIAYSIRGDKDNKFITSVQFHQSYSYEDFIMGYRPTENGFELKTGAFYDFCKKASEDKDNKYFFIVDEINRGNVCKIFGELFVLIENDKRGEEIRLLYDDKPFSIPENVYIIGLMNTADRSLALLDFALRRRFAFYTMKPGFNTESFIKYKERINNAKFNALINKIIELNNNIAQDPSLGEGFCIGHSYFSNLDSSIENFEEKLADIVEYEIEPLLYEYWYDDKDKYNLWVNQLRECIR